MKDILFDRPEKLDFIALDREIRDAGYDISGISANSNNVIVHLNSGDVDSLSTIIKNHRPIKSDEERDVELKKQKQMAREFVLDALKADDFSNTEDILRAIAYLLVGE